MREYDKLARQCAAESLDSRSFLQQLCELELLDREQRATERRIKAAKFPVTKSLDTFDFPSLPALNKKLVLELARCEFIDRRENVLALGNSGTGKTHIGLALGLAACQRGYRTRFTTAAALVNELFEARDERRKLPSDPEQEEAGSLFGLTHRPLVRFSWDGIHYALDIGRDRIGSLPVYTTHRHTHRRLASVPSCVCRRMYARRSGTAWPVLGLNPS